MILNKKNLAKISAKTDLIIPNPSVFELPEKVLQFGTGVLLRGLPDYFIDKANRNGLFNGRIVVVKSTDNGDTSTFDEQDNLYTLCVRGIEDNKLIEENIINSAISRVITAASNWEDVLKLAESPDLSIVFSNTTEIGIQLQDDDIHADPPISFPGKLLAVLLRRYNFFNGDTSKGLIILPAELITDNGTKLKEIVITQAHTHELDKKFISWIIEANSFCNTLVDRIIPGKPDVKTNESLSTELGYSDQLLSSAEVYKLWAIEANEKLADKLTFANADQGIIITPDINLHRELKLRLLNGTHTLCCAPAFLAGCSTVKQAMDHQTIATFITSLMRDEIGPAIPYAVSPIQTNIFSDKVMDRFRNPHIDHYWISISLNYTLKLRIRVIPLLHQYHQLFAQTPTAIALSFAAYLRFMKVIEEKEGKYFGELNGKKYPVNDEYAAWFYQQWKTNTTAELVFNVLKNEELWGTDLTQFLDFKDQILNHLNEINKVGILQAIQSLNQTKISA